MLALGLLLTLPLCAQSAPIAKGPRTALQTKSGAKPTNIPSLPSRQGDIADAGHATKKGMGDAKTKSPSFPVLVVDNYHPYAIDVWTKNAGGDYEYRGRVAEDGYGLYTVRRGYVSVYVECVGLPDEEFWTNTSFVKGDYTLDIDR